MPVSSEQRPEYFEFASKVLGTPFSYGDQCKCLASLSSDGRILGVVIYTRMTQSDCMVTVALDESKRFVSKQFLAYACSVPFVQWNYRRVTAYVRRSNTRSLKGCLKLGFEIEGLLREYFDGEDAVVLGLLKADCKYLSIEVS
ncbi:GNAT family protein [Pusillimonas sp. SM2304]|uniref:GNAT family N-acetyltransferase n=1 Tax=Pusillimonas sp. SM2304 TaxID=3073241 RepID=UPI002876BD84|nr:GNAT family protein [Pusillimonas sp. SM2304]MDS1141701.1 GNAT family protein [Pusillimonas sp. SM2304]